MPANTSEFPLLQLVSNNDFWIPACGRLTEEIVRRTECPKQPDTGNWTAIVKYYGTSLPDTHNVTEDHIAHVAVEVLRAVNTTVSTFAAQCEEWYSELADFASTFRVTKSATNVTLDDGTPVYWNDDESLGPVQDPPYLLGATAGGWRAIRTNDTSIFRLTISIL